MKVIHKALISSYEINHELISSSVKIVMDITLWTSHQWHPMRKLIIL